MMDEYNAGPDATNAEAQELNSFTNQTTTEPARPSSVIDYAWIKAQAKARKCTVDDLLVSARKNDPFYVGTPGELAQAEWFGGVWQNSGFDKAHLRKVHYAHLSNPENKRHNGLPYENTDPDWEYLNSASLAARYLGVVPFAKIVDKKQPDPHIFANYDNEEPTFYVEVPELATPNIETYGFNVSNVQPYHLEVWIEKSTMDDSILPLCEKYKANLVTSTGEFTTAAIEVLIRRIKESGKPTRIFVIADFDPAGVSIRKSFARRVEYFLRRESAPLDVKVCSLGLNPVQVESFNLPRVAIKETETRKDTFERIFGEGGAELDALEVLHPGAIAKLVDGALAPFYSHNAAHELDKREAALRQAVQAKVKAIAEKYQEEIAALEQMNEELREIEIPDGGQFGTVAAEPDPEDDEGFTWLMDSSRDYFEQLAHYRAFEGGAA